MSTETSFLASIRGHGFGPSVRARDRARQRTSGCGTRTGTDTSTRPQACGTRTWGTADPRSAPPSPPRWSASQAYSAFFDLANRPVLELAEALAGAGADAGEGLLRLGRQRRDRHRRQAGASLLVGGRRAGPQRSDQPHRRLSRHARVRDRARRHPQQPRGLRTAGRDDPGAPRLARGARAEHSRGSGPSAWRRCSWSR